MGWAETMAFWDAVEAGLVHAMEAAVLAGASVDHYNAGLATALHKAAEKGDSAMVSALIDSGASVNLKTRIGNDTALLLAAAHGRVESAQALLAGGADMSIKNSKGQTTVASGNRHVQVVKLLAQGTEPQMLAHKRIADSICSTSVASPPDMRGTWLTQSRSAGGQPQLRDVGAGAVAVDGRWQHHSSSAGRLHRGPHGPTP